MKTNEQNEKVLHRLRTLEQQIRRMDEALSNQNADQDDDIPLDTELFDVSSGQSPLTSLSSHINALKKTVMPLASAFPSSPTANRQLRFRNQEEGVRTFSLRNLPSLPRLRYLVSMYFDHMNPFIPCVGCDEFKARLSVILAAQSVGDDNLRVQVTPETRSFLMLMCVILATATYLDPASHPGESRTLPGWRYLLMAEEISGKDHYLRSLDIDLDLVRYHIVKSMYMAHIEGLTAAYRAIGTAVQIACSIGLNDESTWKDMSQSQKIERRLLWWTLFYVDRRVAQKCWKPYLIRENEVNVEELENSDTIIMEQAFAIELDVHDGTLLATRRYLHAAAQWARLWAAIWDAMFSARALKGEKRSEEIEILDARLLHAQRKTDESLQWETRLLPTYIAAGESEARMRSRLVAWLVSYPSIPRLACLAFHEVLKKSSTCSWFEEAV